VGWGALALVGLLLSILAGWGAQRHKSSVARTTLVVSEVQSGIQAIGVEALMAARGNPGSIDALRAWRGKVNVSMTLLEKGGYANPSDPAPVISLPNEAGVSLEPLRQALAKMDAKIRPLEESASQLRDAAAAEKTLAQSLEQINKALLNIERSPQLASGGWGNALASTRSVLSRPEMKTMQVIFSPLPGAETLQGSWAQQFGQLNQQLAVLVAGVDKDTSLSASSKTQVRSLASGVETLAGATAVLSQTLPARLAAQGLQGPIQEAITEVQAPIGTLGTQIVALQNERAISEYLGWLGSLMALVGLIGLGFATWALARDHWEASHARKQGAGVADALERATNTLKRILSGDANYLGSGRLEESPESPTFALSSMVNRVLERQEDQREKQAALADQMLSLLAELTNRNVRIKGLGTTLRDHSNSSSGLSNSMARALAVVVEESSTSPVQELVELSASLEMQMQEGGFKMDQSRENIQSASKLLKRFAEGAQNIAEATNVLDGISRQIKVLSTNTAIQAAMLGEPGRRFSVLATETERLSSLAHETAADVAKEVQSIQADAQNAVAAMERSTAEVVASGQISGRAASTVRDLESVLGNLSKTIENGSRNLEKQTIVSLSISKGCDESTEASKQVLEEGTELASDLDKMKVLVRQLKA